MLRFPGLRIFIILATFSILAASCGVGDDDVVVDEPGDDAPDDAEEDAAPDTPQEDTSDDIHIGVVLPSLTIEAIANLAAGIEARAEEVGRIEITVVDTLDIEEMVRAMEDFVARGVDAIIYDTIDAPAMTTGVEAANRAGIPVVATVAAADGGEHLTFIAADERSGGEEVGAWLGEHLDGSGSAAIVQGAAGDQANRLRHEGMLEVLQADYPDVEIVADLPADWMTDRALVVTADVLTANPDVNAIFAVNDDMAYGVLEAVDEAGRVGDATIVGYNGDCRVFEHILAGEMHAVGVLFLGSVGQLAVDAVLDHLDGEEVPEEIISPVLVIDQPALEEILAGDYPAGLEEPYLSEFEARAQQAADGC